MKRSNQWEWQGGNSGECGMIEAGSGDYFMRAREWSTVFSASECLRSMDLAIWKPLGMTTRAVLVEWWKWKLDWNALKTE